MLTIFKTKPLLDQSSADWMFDTFAWALELFDRDEFFNRSRLIQPSNEFFPGRVSSVHDKAETIFKATLGYAGLSHWPFVLQPPEQFHNQPTPLLNVEGFERDSTQTQLPALSNTVPLCLSYNPPQALKSEDLASSFAHNIAQHVVYQSQSLPPGGADYFLEATEVVAIFMGFGVLFANSAYTFRGGCGSCYNAQANRSASLSEDDVVFALALYCRLKNIPNAEATRLLKKHLKGSFKKALKQIDAQPPEKLNRLLAFNKSSGQ